MYDLNDAEQQREGGIIPVNTYCKLSMAVRPGGDSIPNSDPADQGIFKASASSDVMMLDCEFSVMQGPFARRKIWQNFVISGGKLDEKGNSMGWNVSKSTLRAMIESAVGISPDDMSDAAKQQRVFQAFKQLDGLQFYAKLGVEPGQQKPGTNPAQYYPDKNKIAHVVTVKDKEYEALRSGQEVNAPAPAPAPATAWSKQPAANSAAPITQPAKTATGPAWLRS